MSNQHGTHKQEESELQKFKLFYEHVSHNRSTRPSRNAKTVEQLTQLRK